MVRLRLTLEQRRAVTGILFVFPLIIGATMFFLIPFVQSIIFSLNDLQVSATGYALSYVGFDNYREALLVNADYPRLLTETLLKTLSSIPIIIIFSFLVATILNQKFRGRMVARLIFFLPVILASGAVELIVREDLMHQAAAGETYQIQEFLLSAAEQLLLNMKLPPALLEYVVAAVGELSTIITASGIPIIILLAALQSISGSLYEAAAIEGATGWESFWSVTFPLVSPMILATIIYTIVDSFTAPGNDMMRFIVDGTWGNLGFGLSMAMAWIYFIIIFIILAIAIGIISRRVFYQE